MANWKIISLVTGIAGAGGFLGHLYYAGRQLEFVPTLSVHRIGLDGITLRVDTLVKNPGSTTLRIQQPHVKLRYQNSDLGSSQPSPSVKTFSAHASGAFDAIYISLPATNLILSAPSLIRDVAQNKAVSLEVQIRTKVYRWGIGVPLPVLSLPITLQKGN